MAKGLTSEQIEDFIRYVQDDELRPEQAAVKIGIKANSYRYWLKESGYRMRKKNMVEPIEVVPLPGLEPERATAAT